MSEFSTQLEEIELVFSAPGAVFSIDNKLIRLHFVEEKPALAQDYTWGLCFPSHPEAEQFSDAKRVAVLLVVAIARFSSLKVPDSVQVQFRAYRMRIPHLGVQTR